ncbi:MAG: hypothetical protein ACI4J2_04505, partial [Ruminococcus sp.]
KFTIFHNRNTLYRACENWSGVSRPHLYFAVPTAIFTLLRDWSYATFSLYLHGSDYMILEYGAVIMLAGRQSGETIFRHFLSRF